MNDKVFKKLQHKFFYTPLIIGWLMVILACTLVFYVTYTDTYDNAQKQLLKAGDADAPFFDSTNLVYIIESQGNISTQQIENSYTQEELDELVYLVFNSEVDSNSFVSSQKRHYMFTIKSSTIQNNVKETVYVIYEFTDSINTLKTLAITQIAIVILANTIIFFVFYYYSKHAIAPVKNYFARQQDLIANASHELKTPLTIIRTNIDVIESDPNATIRDNQKWFDSTNNQIDRMNNLVLDMLELARIDANQSKYMRENICVNELLQGILLSFEAPCYEKNIQFDYSFDDNCIVYASNDELEKVCTILLDNAIKYTPSHGKISVTMQKSRRNIIITITNTGEGIPAQHLDKIFDRFYKVDPSHKETHNSFGLGLSIAKSIVVSLKGNIKCESQVGEYTRFVIDLPASINLYPENKKSKQ